MKETIDLYAKLVIGTFSFIGPSFTLLIPLFYKAFAKAVKIHKSKLRNLLLIENEGEDNDEISKMIARNRKELNLLNPKRQVRRIFIDLLSTLGFIAFYYFQASHFWDYKYEWMRAISIFASALFFAHCLFVLWQVFCTIISIKKEEEDSILAKQDESKGTIKITRNPKKKI